MTNEAPTFPNDQLGFGCLVIHWSSGAWSLDFEHGPDRQDFRKKKTLSATLAAGASSREILLTKQRDRLFKKIGDISTTKQKIFQQGAQQKSPELRKALAQDFELKTQEQLMAARELNLRSKELMTVSRCAS
jgi:hypothetical protein